MKTVIWHLANCTVKNVDNWRKWSDGKSITQTKSNYFIIPLDTIPLSALSVMLSCWAKTNPHSPVWPLSTSCILTSCDKAKPSHVLHWQLTLWLSTRCEICVLVPDMSQITATHKPNYKALTIGLNSRTMWADLFSL